MTCLDKKQTIEWRINEVLTCETIKSGEEWNKGQEWHNAEMAATWITLRKRQWAVRGTVYLHCDALRKDKCARAVRSVQSLRKENTTLTSPIACSFHVNNYWLMADTLTTLLTADFTNKF